MNLSNRFNAIRAVLYGKKERANKAATNKATANKAAANKAVANAKANAEAAAKENAEANNFELELEYALRVAQNLGNLYKKGNEQAFINAYKKLPKGARGKPLKVDVNKAYSTYMKNIKPKRVKNAYLKSIQVPNWMPANKVNAYKTLVTNLALQKSTPKMANFKAAVKTWLNTQVPQSPARAARQVENAITGQKRIIPAYVPKKRTSPTLPTPPSLPKKVRKERAPPNRRLNYVYTIPKNAVNLSNTLESLGVNTRKNMTWNEIRVALKGKATATQMKKLKEKWTKNVMNKVKFGAVGPLKRKV
jgi:hypothetical protein